MTITAILSVILILSLLANALLTIKVLEKKPPIEVYEAPLKVVKQERETITLNTVVELDRIIFREPNPLDNPRNAERVSLLIQQASHSLCEDIVKKGLVSVEYWTNEICDSQIVRLSVEVVRPIGK